MRPFRDMPIKQKLIAMMMSITAVALLLSGVGVVASDSVYFRQNMLRDSSTLSQVISTNSTAAVDFDDPRAAADTLSSLKARAHIVAACIYRSDGGLFASYLRPGAGVACPPGRGPDELRFTSNGLVSRTPIVVRGSRIGTLVMLMDLGPFYERIRTYGITVLCVLLASGLLALMLSSKLQAKIAEPISHLAQTARSVSETRDYSIRARKLSRDELGELGEDFNRMLVRIQSQDRDLRVALLAQEAALKETREIRDSLRTTLASIGDAVVSTDVAGRAVFVNEVAQWLLGMAENEIVGQKLEDVFRIVNEFTGERVESPVAQVLREGRIGAMANHTMLISRSGAHFPIDDSVAPIRDENGAIRGAVLVFRDVTPRRRAEETGRLLVSIVESSDDAIFSMDLNGMVTSWNHGAERIFGFTAQEMIDRSIVAIVPPSRQLELTNILDSIRRGDPIAHQETVRRTKDGDSIHVSVNVSPLRDPLGRISGAAVISRDITEQVRAADRLAQLNADLQHSNRTLALTNQDLERFAFIASHDLQEPLRMITAYSQLLIKSYRGDFDEQAAGFVNVIVEGTARMRELLTDLLAYTEIRTREDDTPEIVDLNSVIPQVMNNLKTAIEESGATVTFERLPVLRAYRGHFQPLFQNLIGNAIKYRSAAPPHIHISVSAVEGELRYSVSDNGIGIAPAYHQQIFEVFRRLHGKQIPGTGVGLAICQRVVERYGGRIWVESEEGKGTTFLFTLPNAAVQTAERGE